MPRPKRTLYGNLVRMYRNRIHVSQKKLAGLTGIAEITIAKIETGSIKRSNRLTVKVLADTFCLSEVERADFFQAADQKYTPPPMYKDTVSPEVARLQHLIDKHPDAQGRSIRRTTVRLADKIEETIGYGNKNNARPRPLEKLRGYSPQESISVQPH